MSNIKEANLQIEKLQRKIDFIKNNLKYLDNNNIKYLLVDHGKKYSCMVEINDNLSMINDIVSHYNASKEIKNDIGAASGKTWENISPYLIKCSPFRNEYSHLEHYINVTYKVNEEFEMNLKVNIKLLDNLKFFSQATEETKHFKKECQKDYETIISLNEDIISRVLFYGNNFYYYASNNLEVKTIKNILNIQV